MRRLRLLALALLFCWAGAAPAQNEPPPGVDPRLWLVQQIRLGEALHRDELARDALARLYQISPRDPMGLEAEIRRAIRLGEQSAATALLAELGKRAPGSLPYRRAKLLVELQGETQRSALQQARLLASAGRLDQALAIYDGLFNGLIPTLELTLEYWKLRSRLPGGAAPALAALLETDKEYPRHTPLRQTLVNLLFALDRDDEALAVLHELAREPLARSAAAQRELEFLSAQPPSELTARRWRDYMALYAGTSSYDSALRLQAALQRLLDDPAWQAGQRGLALVEAGKNQEAEIELKRGLQAYPGDAKLLGALGLVYMRKGQRALALRYFEQARDKESNGFHADKWAALINSTRFWLILDQAEASAQRGLWARAQELYLQAHRQDASNLEALLGLGDAAQGLGDTAQAERYYRQALRLDPSSARPARRLINLYEAEPEKVTSFIDSLPPAARQPFAGLRRRLELDRLTEAAKTALAENRLRQAAELLSRAREIDPDDVWTGYRLATTRQQLGDGAGALAVFEDILRRHAQSAEARYAHALFLSSRDQHGQALQSLHAIPERQWTDNMRELAARLERQRRLAHADALRAAGDEAQAVAFLRRQPADSAVDHRLADWAQQRGDYPQAHAAYERILSRDPDDLDARLGQIEAWLDEGRKDKAAQALGAGPLDRAADASVNQRRRYANALAAAGDLAKARALMHRLVSTQQEPDALLKRDAARLMSDQDPQQALRLYAQAMQDNGILPAGAGPDSDAYTRATRADPADDWLRRSLRRDVETLYQRQNPSITLHNEFWGRTDGTAGYSDLKANTTILQGELPYKGGQAFFRVEHVIMDAGRFSTGSDGRHDEYFGTCALQACPGGSQRAQGVGLALGWRNDKIEADIGVTPLGFKVVDVVGGLTYRGKLGSVGWSLTASRRPMSNSLLSYAGTQDPNTGLVWGGVRATGVNLGLSWDQGGPNGVWANLGYQRLTGKNVASNQRVRLMAGYYRRLIDTPDRRLTAGVNVMAWHYDKDLGGYTLGQGGYYSPQRYYSLSLPLRYSWRNENWTYTLGGSVSVSHAKSKASPDYPLKNKLAGLQGSGVDGTSSAGSSNGTGYSLFFQAERRISRHLVLGAGIDIQRSDDYAPSRAMLYLRYSFEPWSGNLPLPPSTLEPYAEFR